MQFKMHFYILDFFIIFFFNVHQECLAACLSTNQVDDNIINLNFLLDWIGILNWILWIICGSVLRDFWWFIRNPSPLTYQWISIAMPDTMTPKESQISKKKSPLPASFYFHNHHFPSSKNCCLPKTIQPKQTISITIPT